MDRRFSPSGSLYEPPGKGDFPLKMARDTGAQAFIYHWHDAAEVLLGLSGETTAAVADRPYRLAEGDVLLIPPGESHCLFPSGAGDTRLVLMFEPGFFLGGEPYADVRQKLPAIPLHSGQWDNETRETAAGLLFRLERAFFGRGPGWQAEAAGFTLLLAAALTRLPPRQERGGHPGQDDTLRAVLQYLSEHYTGEVNLGSCAAALGFTPSYLSALFKAKTGATFHRYLLNLRLKRAEWLLRSTALPVARIAEESGFVSEKTFYRVFKEQYRMTPLQYRKEKSG